MAEPVRPPRLRAVRFGIDAPHVPAILGAAGLAFLVGGLLLDNLWFGLPGVILLIQTALYLHTTLRGKHLVWARLLDDANLAGDEVALDLGCGRGAVLLALADRLPRGRAHGVDLWRSVDQSGNDESATRANAVAVGVGERIELHTADISDLPFDDATFDLVVSSLAIHNIKDAKVRSTVIDEALRVLRPDGRLIIADFRHVADYAERLRTLGALEVSVRSLGPNYWYGSPLQATSVVTAKKHRPIT
jgi:SAM-dependent methyltransferase